MITVRQILHNVLAVVILTLLVPCPLLASSGSLMIFAGAASKPPTEEAARIYKQKRGVEVQITFGGSGFVLSQMKLARRGDVYFPGSSDFMEKAKRDGLVFPETERIVAYLIPAINVQKGNPKKIESLKDLPKPGLRLAMADPESVCVGTYAVEVSLAIEQADREVAGGENMDGLLIMRLFAQELERATAQVRAKQRGRGQAKRPVARPKGKAQLTATTTARGLRQGDFFAQLA